MLPYLEIDQQMLDAGGALQVMWRIESWMLWPHDEMKRRESIETASIETIREDIRLQVAANGPNAAVPLTAGELLGLSESMRSTKLLRDIHEEAKGAYLHGLTAGYIATYVLKWSTIDGDRAGIQSAKAEALVRIAKCGGNGLPKISSRTIENWIWPTYRPVAHLWAAYCLAVECDRRAAFPCRMDDVASFLAKAEHLRQLGEKFRPKQSPNSLFGPDMIKVPEDVCLPAFKVSFVSKLPSPT